MKNIIVALLVVIASSANAGFENLEMRFENECNDDNYGKQISVETFSYVSIDGDSLSSLSKRFYGDGNLWPIIFYDNLGKHDVDGPYWGMKLYNPEMLYKGIVLSIRKDISNLSKENVFNWLKESYYTEFTQGVMWELTNLRTRVVKKQKEFHSAIVKNESKK